jgi:hypothetical protein
LSIVGHPSISPAFKNLLPFCSDEWKLGFIVMNEGFVFEFRYKNNKKMILLDLYLNVVSNDH